MSRILRLFGCAWSVARSLCGDDRYERYLAHLATAHPGSEAPDRRRFYRDMLARKWSGVARCC